MSNDIKSVRTLAESELAWYGIAPQPEEVVMIMVAGWFPTESFCGVKNRKFDDSTAKAKKYGFILGNGNRGSMSGFVLKSHAEKMIKRLAKLSA